ILTAAHCVTQCSQPYDWYGECRVSDPGFTYVTVGTSDPRTTTIFNASQIIVHPDYHTDQAPEADIAVIQLRTPLTYSKEVQPIKIYTGQIADNAAAQVIGWGQIEEGQSPTASAPYEADIRMSNDRQLCNVVEGLNFQNSNGPLICSAKDNYKGPCLGDSGGPL
ncbi:trypsin-like cysteine/serine peptidase domain-containing protein, partial [Dimargaris cristalligena]